MYQLPNKYLYLYVVGAPSVFDPCLSSNTVKSFSHHLAVLFIINMDKPDSIRRKITYRIYHALNIKEFIEDLQSSQDPIKCEVYLWTPLS